MSPPIDSEGPHRGKKPTASATSSPAARSAAVEIAGCTLPDDVRVDLEHDVWWRWQPDGSSARVGILATVAAFAGTIHEVTFRPVSGVVSRGRSVATLESYRYTGAVRLPVDAAVIERNEPLREHPRWLNDRTYTDGWVVTVRPERPTDPERLLTSPLDARPHLEETIRTRRIRCWPRTPEVQLVEVGSECAAVLARLNEELQRLPTDTALLLVSDDPTSPIEMVRWSDQTGYPVLAHRAEGALHEFLVEKVAHPEPRRRRGGA